VSRFPPGPDKIKHTKAIELCTATSQQQMDSVPSALQHKSGRKFLWHYKTNISAVFLQKIIAHYNWWG
jgi:hypothetical protein